jgi:hypothetical protein
MKSSLSPELHAALNRWLQLCAVQKCDIAEQDTLLATFGPMVRNRMKAKRAHSLESETFDTRPGDTGQKTRLAAFCDKIFYNYQVIDDDTARAAKAVILSNHPNGLLKTIKFRFGNLVDKMLRQESTILGEFPDSIDTPEFQENRIAEYYKDGSVIYDDEAIPVKAVVDFIEEPATNETGFRVLWLRSHSYFIRDAKETGFIPYSKSQFYSKIWPSEIARLVCWLDRNYPHSVPGCRIEFHQDLCDAIEQRLVATKALPADWLTKLRTS